MMRQVPFNPLAPDARRYRPRGFSLLELLLSIAIIAVLIGLLLPLLVYARSAARNTICAGNLRQMSTAWSLYLSEYSVFPQYTKLPDWNYGGAAFDDKTGNPSLAADRPLNAFMAEETDDGSEKVSLLFRCPSDKGIAQVSDDSPDHLKVNIPIIPSCFEQFGTSYRANPYLMDSTRAGIDTLHRPLALHEIEYVPSSRLLLVGDAEWYYASVPEDKAEHNYDASWHDKPNSGNMLAVDGSVRFVEFQTGEGTDYLIYPRPQPIE